jgi:AraC-like DNA-binding protein
MQNLRCGVRGESILRISSVDLDSLMSTLEVNFVRLTECLVSPGWRLALGGSEVSGIHYILAGTGTMNVEGHPAIELVPHILIITPPKANFYIEFPSDQHPVSDLTTINGRLEAFPTGSLRRFVAGNAEPKLIMICGYFRASYGASMNLFGTITSSIVEHFDAADGLDDKLKATLAELVAQEVGMGAMTTGLLKQVLVALLRRSLSSMNSWAERFSMLSDPHVARAFADMAAHPGAPHSVHSLAQSACLSRSAFMARFTRLVGVAPMTALRELRMRHASALLLSDNMSIDQIAQNVGYMSRSSFLRAFQRAYGCDPSEYRSVARNSSGESR